MAKSGILFSPYANYFLMQRLENLSRVSIPVLQIKSKRKRTGLLFMQCESVVQFMLFSRWILSIFVACCMDLSRSECMFAAPSWPGNGFLFATVRGEFHEIRTAVSTPLPI